jgi:hypothetical protein
MDPSIFTFGFGAYVWLSTAPYPGKEANGRILKLIRFECDEMTRRTPFVSFHVAVAGPYPGVKANGRILNLIRFECDEMTRRTPLFLFMLLRAWLTTFM